MTNRQGEKAREYSRAWYQKNKEKVKAHRRAYYQTHKEQASSTAKNNRQRAKKLVFEHYSGSPARCVRCGISDLDVLCIDHINGGGTKIREDTRHWGDKLYFYLIRNNFPEGFQILCANCNQKKFVREGI